MAEVALALALLLLLLAVVFGVVLAVLTARAAQDRRRLGLRIQALEHRLAAVEPQSRAERAARFPETASVEAPLPTAPAPTAPAPPPERPVPTLPSIERDAPPSPAESPPAQRPTSSVEAFVGGRVFLVAGVVVVLFGLAFFLKLAIDLGWIDERARVISGFALGVAALVGGDRLRARGLAVFGHAIMGGGLGAIYLSNYFASVRYGLLDRPSALAVAAAVTAVGVVLSLWRDGQLLAWLGLVGGFLAPALLDTGRWDLSTLTVWLVTLNLGIAALLTRRRWSPLLVLPLVADPVYLALWDFRHGTAATTLPLAAALAALLAAHLVAALLPPATSRSVPAPLALGTALVAGVAGYTHGAVLLQEERRYLFGGAVLALAAAYLAAARLLVVRREDARPAARTLELAAVASAAAALPWLLSGLSVAPGWALLGAAGALGARRGGRTGFLVLGGLLQGLALVELALFRLPDLGSSPWPWANGPFLAFAAPCAGLLLVGRATRGTSPALGALLATAGAWLLAALAAAEPWVHLLRVRGADPSTGAAAGAAVLAAVAAALAWATRGSRGKGLLAGGPLVAALALGLWLAFAGHARPFTAFANPVFAGGAAVVACTAAALPALRPWPRALLIHAAAYLGAFLLAGEILAEARLERLPRPERAARLFRAQVALSVAWAVYAAALLATGFLIRSAAVRWAALVLFALTLGKVFLVDLAGVEALYRIGSFLVLGMLLVGASFLYQRARAAG